MSDYELDNEEQEVLVDPSDEIIYWSTKTPIERMVAIELMRQIIYGYDPTSTRLQRVLTITQRA